MWKVATSPTKGLDCPEMTLRMGEQFGNSLVSDEDEIVMTVEDGNAVGWAHGEGERWEGVCRVSTRQEGNF